MDTGAPRTQDDPLAQPAASLRGVGPERSAQLARLGIMTIGDLLMHRPRRYEDRRRFRTIAQLVLGEPASIRGTVVAQGLKRFRHGRQSVFECVLEDGTGRLHCRWWNLPFMQNCFQVGDDLLAFGKLVAAKPRTMDHPETEVIETGAENWLHLGRIVPVYPLTEGLPQRWLRGLIWRALEEFEGRIVEPWPRAVLSDLPTRAQALQHLHFPAQIADAEQARRRLALDEFVVLQAQMLRRRHNLAAHALGHPCAGDNRLIRPFLARLGFALTQSQTNVLRELRHDLGQSPPMRRLLQGDVGSGKTVVAACGALMALESGFTVVLMAPTEVLAEQHFRTFQQWFGPLGIRVDLQTGAYKTGTGRPAKAAGDRRLGENEAQGPEGVDARGRVQNPQLVVGTHALIADTFAVDNLGLVIIDEQHKFGVAQREKLLRKGHYPHLLVMTATPIPRTLGLTLYGDLDCSVIDQMPPGRGQVRTYVRGADHLPRVWEFVRGKLAAGSQAYVVYPLIEESGKVERKAVMAEFNRLAAALAPWKTGLLHGRLRPEEKESVLEAFRANAIQVLLATTVVEVGLDVPNATIMLIENAEQFGLAQLHQLRGRIGRGAQDAYCILVADLKTEEARQRLEVLAETTDGFRIAEADLRLRGPGDFLGRQQSGLPPLRFGDLTRDCSLIERARGIAAAGSAGGNCGIVGQAAVARACSAAW